MSQTIAGQSKFGRSYRVTIEPNDGGPEILVTMPLTLNFNVVRNTQASLNEVFLNIYNLKPATRGRIFQDSFTPGKRKVTLEIGYDNLSQVFTGNIYRATSFRQGQDIITQIYGRDGNYDVLTTQTYQTFAKNKTVSDLLKFLIGQFPTLQLGAVGDFSTTLLRPAALSGNTFDLLKKYSMNQAFVDNGKVYVLQKNEVISGGLAVINPDSGLLETPRRDESVLTLTTLLEPRITTKQLVSVESAILPVYNGTYQVIGVAHQGTISGAVNGMARSTFTLLANNRFGPIKQVGN